MTIIVDRIIHLKFLMTSPTSKFRNRYIFLVLKGLFGISLITFDILHKYLYYSVFLDEQLLSDVRIREFSKLDFLLRMTHEHVN